VLFAELLQVADTKREVMSGKHVEVRT